MQKKIGLILILTMTLTLMACGKETSVTTPQTATTVEEVTIDLSSVDMSTEVSTENKVSEECVIEPEYVFKDCFDENAVLIDNANDFYEYLNDHEALTIRAYASKRIFPDNTTRGLDNSTCEEIFNYTTYAGIYKAMVDSEEVSALNVYNVDGSNICVPIKDAYNIDIPLNSKLSDIYQLIVKCIGINNYTNSMFIAKDTEITKEQYESITYDDVNNCYRIVSDYPKEAVYNILRPDENYDSIESGYMNHELKTTEDNTVIPSRITGFIQYINSNNQMVVYSLSMVIMPSDYMDIEEFLNASCNCGGGCGCGCDAIDAFTFTDMDAVKYVKNTMNVRNLPTTNGEVVASLQKGDKVYITGQCNETNWYRFDYNGQAVYGSDEYLID